MGQAGFVLPTSQPVGKQRLRGGANLLLPLEPELDGAHFFFEQTLDHKERKRFSRGQRHGFIGRQTQLPPQFGCGGFFKDGPEESGLDPQQFHFHIGAVRPRRGAGRMLNVRFKRSGVPGGREGRFHIQSLFHMRT